MAIFADGEFWILVAFIIAFGFLVYKASPLVTGALDKRAGQIKAELDEAQSLREEAQRALAEYQRKQRDALKEAEEIIALSRGEAERAAERAARDLEAALERRKRLASEKIALEEAKALADVRNTAVDFAIAAVRQILTQDLDATRRGALIDQAIAALPQALH
jgi:F-type H+-transporting ATPase subunit b